MCLEYAQSLDSNELSFYFEKMFVTNVYHYPLFKDQTPRDSK